MKDIELTELQRVANDLNYLLIKTKNPNLTLSVEGIRQRQIEIEEEKRNNPELFELKYHVGELLNILRKEGIIL